MRYDKDDDESWDEPGFDEDDDDDLESEPTRDCPYCGREMLEICVQCPSCGQYLSQEDGARSRQPRWVILGAVLCLGTLLFWMLLKL